MSGLEEYLVELIRQGGPLTMDRYMSLCLGHPEFGYYMSRDPFGRGGDFTTAPEVSQIFGELIGIWCVSTWQTMKVPDPFHLIELGPGRGTLMADLLRAGKVMPGFLDAVQVHLIETSPVLKAVQEETLAKSGLAINWHSDTGTVPDGPAIIVGNEFFDALPVQQIERREDGWHERVIGVDDNDKLTIGLASDRLPEAAVPAWLAEAEAGEIAELAPVRADYANRLAERTANSGGALLFIDYGHLRSGAGDTIQAVKGHKPVDILSEPGECDLTAHVDFAALGEVFERCGLTTYGPVSQSQFLAGMGIAERVEMLSKRGDARQRMKISDGARRLVAGTEMGHLFKAIVATDKAMATPAPFAQMEGAAS